MPIANAGKNSSRWQGARTRWSGTKEETMRTMRTNSQCRPQPERHDWPEILDEFCKAALKCGWSVPTVLRLTKYLEIAFDEWEADTAEYRSTAGASFPRASRAHRRSKHSRKGKGTRRYTSIRELARVNQINESYACRELRLSLLSPSIVERIISGHLHSSADIKN
jgi:hypothetical protein